jgi:thiamine-phosphate pyrophosphorylase
MTLGPLAARRPLVCLVTDRRALAAAVGDGREPAAMLLDQVTAAAAAGVDLVQVRERDLDARDLASLVRGCVSRAAASGTLVVVNDRVDVALAGGAAGVHLRGDSAAADRVRAVAPAGFLVGRSVRSADEAVAVAAGGGVDYLVLGTIFPTPSKPGLDTVLGPGELERAARLASVPVLAIGGVTLDTLPAVARAGAAGFAAIRAFQHGAASPADLAREVRAWRRVFDMHRAIP